MSESHDTATVGDYADAEAQATERIMADLEGTPEPVATPPVSAEPTDVDDQPEAPESFSNIDPATLQGENLELYKEMQADYTKKTQEIAAYRELGYDPDTLQQAVDFTSRLTSDPNYAAEVVEELYDLVKQSGIDPFEGKFAEALAPETEGDPDGTIPDVNDPYADPPSVDPALQAQLSELTNQLQTIQHNEAERQEAHEIQTLQIDLDKQEASIRSEHPSYDENDISMIHRLAWSTEGNLLEANELYQSNIQQNAERYLDSKASGQSQPDAPTSGGHSEPPQTFEGLDDPNLEELAMLRLTQALEADGKA